jgi:hypothetical protein
MSANCSQPPGPEHPVNLGEDGVLVGAEIDDPVGDHDVGPGVLHWQGLGEAGAELDEVQAESGGGRRRLLQHLRGHVHADDAAGGPDLRGGEEGVEAGAGADVDDTVAGAERSQREEVGHAGEPFDGPVGQGGHGVVVAERRASSRPVWKWKWPAGSVATARYFSRTWSRSAPASTSRSGEVDIASTPPQVAA